MGRDVLGRLGRCDLLENNAGFGILKNVGGVSIAEVQLITSHTSTAWPTVPKLSSTRCLPKIHGTLNVASVAKSFGIAGHATYCRSEFAVLGFSKSLFHEL
jgi:short-subunit dehydrogenase